MTPDEISAASLIVEHKVEKISSESAYPEFIGLLFLSYFIGEIVKYVTMQQFVSAITEAEQRARANPQQTEGAPNDTTGKTSEASPDITKALGSANDPVGNTGKTNSE